MPFFMLFPIYWILCFDSFYFSLFYPSLSVSVCICVTSQCHCSELVRGWFNAPFPSITTTPHPTRIECVCMKCCSFDTRAEDESLAIDWNEGKFSGNVTCGCDVYLQCERKIASEWCVWVALCVCGNMTKLIILTSIETIHPFPFISHCMFRFFLEFFPLFIYIFLNKQLFFCSVFSFIPNMCFHFNISGLSMATKNIILTK